VRWEISAGIFSEISEKIAVNFGEKFARIFHTVAQDKRTSKNWGNV